MNAGCREEYLTVLAGILFGGAGCHSNVKKDEPGYAITASEVAKQDLALHNRTADATKKLRQPSCVRFTLSAVASKAGRMLSGDNW